MAHAFAGTEAYYSPPGTAVPRHAPRVATSPSLPRVAGAGALEALTKRLGRAAVAVTAPAPNDSDGSSSSSGSNGGGGGDGDANGGSTPLPPLQSPTSPHLHSFATTPTTVASWKPISPSSPRTPSSAVRGVCRDCELNALTGGTCGRW